MRIRGIECAAPDGYAEAFHGRKLSLLPEPAASRSTGASSGRSAGSRDA